MIKTLEFEYRRKCRQICTGCVNNYKSEVHGADKDTQQSHNKFIYNKPDASASMTHSFDSEVEEIDSAFGGRHNVCKGMYNIIMYLL